MCFNYLLLPIMVQVDFKLVLLGRHGVGKSSVFHRIMQDSFVHNTRESTIGAAFAAKPFFSEEGRRVVIGIWDTAGKERYEAMSKIFYRDAKVAIICYNICERESWDKMKFWINELRENEEDCKIYLCGTKKDLVDDGMQRRQVEYEMATRFAKGIQSKLFETSSKTGENIVLLFQTIVEEYFGSKNSFETFAEEETVKLNVVSETKTNSRCRC